MKILEEKLNKIKKFYFKNKRLPSYSEMLKMFGLSSKKSIYDLVKKFIEKGFLQKKDGKLSPTSLFFSLPVLGIVKAGFPIMADEQREYLSLEEYLIDDPNSNFLFKVKGDSLVEIGIFEGDFVIIKKTKMALPGDVVLAEIDGEWTLKVFRKNRKGLTYLEPANTNYPVLYPKFRLDIFGVVQAVVRKMRN